MHKRMSPHRDYDYLWVNNIKIEKVIFNCGPFDELEKTKEIIYNFIITILINMV